jgi:hypothetical protein
MSYISNPLALIPPIWEAFKKAFVTGLLLTLAAIGATVALFVALGIVGSVLGLVLGPFSTVVILLAFPVLALLGGAYGWASTKVLIAAARGHQISFKDSLPKQWLEPLIYVATSFVVGTIVLIGLLFFIIPGLIFISWFALATYLVVDKGLTPIEAMKRSRELARGREWEVLGAAAITSSIALVRLVPVLGAIIVLFVTIVMSPALAVRYEQLLQLKKSPGWEKLPIHYANFVILIVAVVSSVIVQITLGNEFQKQLQEQIRQNTPNRLEDNIKPY